VMREWIGLESCRQVAGLANPNFFGTNPSRGSHKASSGAYRDCMSIGFGERDYILEEFCTVVARLFLCLWRMGRGKKHLAYSV